jgi:hypothetical protein
MGTGVLSLPLLVHGMWVILTPLPKLKLGTGLQSIFSDGAGRFTSGSATNIHELVEGYHTVSVLIRLSNFPQSIRVPVSTT